MSVGIRPEVSPANRETQILAAAAREFAAKGYDASSMQDIANAVGISKATLYHYFKSKEELSNRLSNRTIEDMFGYVVHHSTSGSARTRLTNFMTAHARFFEENHAAFLSMILIRNPAAVDRGPDASLWRDRYEAHLRALLREGVRSGEFRGIDPVVTGRAILSCLNWMVRWFNPGGTQRAEDVARNYADLFLRGLEERS
ncbi:TetR/AcrR family transcriptional regulator [Deinococcus peraridilitoris]|uniref:Transcriptional regulator n=1 Tax=Deinococcus peraridilitoris (strain DSM 19664 / LMG 22246 / CIP 109416 / KR-200) TaxID=937777 RepID=K9ZYV1_DEIPD|nr:TetR/AcrR family transcriptional regulator [Deinococcus peraridilitoris]AFZ66766.1 transcriptional regulator [Deinococcus peraridilitoris DSM 19664]